MNHPTTKSVVALSAGWRTATGDSTMPLMAAPAGLLGQLEVLAAPRVHPLAEGLLLQVRLPHADRGSGPHDRDPREPVGQPHGRPLPQRMGPIGGEGPAQTTFLVEVADHLLRLGDLARRLLLPGV